MADQPNLGVIARRAAGVQHGKHPRKTQHKAQTQQPAAKSQAAAPIGTGFMALGFLVWTAILCAGAVIAWRILRALMGHREVVIRHEYTR